MTDKTAPEERSRDASREPLNDMEDGSVPASLPTADPAETLSRLLNGYQATQALHVAARLGIVDVLQDGPKTAQVLADRVGAHEPSLRRFLGFLTTLGLLTHDSEGHFAATPSAPSCAQIIPSPSAPGPCSWVLHPSGNPGVSCTRRS
jgi:hypothetical protein